MGWLYTASLMAVCRYKYPLALSKLCPVAAGEARAAMRQSPFLVSPFPRQLRLQPASLAPAESDGAAGDWGLDGMLTRQKSWTNKELVGKQQTLVMHTRWLVSRYRRLQ